MTDQPPKPYVTVDNQLDALALIEAVANGDEAGERTILRNYIDEDDAGGLVAGLTVAAIVLANVGVGQNAWPTAFSALQLARQGIIDTEGNKS